jgi:hypothetical protein
MEWKLPSEKARKARNAIFEMFHAEKAPLQALQSLVGRLNDVALMCPFLTAFRGNISVLQRKKREEPTYPLDLFFSIKKQNGFQVLYFLFKIKEVKGIP